MRKAGLLLLCVLSLGIAVAGCATVPTGPSVMVLPATGKPFEQFQSEDVECRQWATHYIGGAPPGAPMGQNTAVGAVAGTALGAGLGAAIGAASGAAGAGAAIGAASGLLGGSLVGSNYDYASGWEAQRRYDMAYQQCMYAKGNQIPGVVRPYHSYSVPSYPPPPPGYSSSAPPPPYSSAPPAPAGGYPPPPPPGPSGMPGPPPPPQNSVP